MTMLPPRHTDAFDVVAMVGSQGAFRVVRALVRALPADFPAAVVYVQHRVATAGSGLVRLLSRDTALPVRLVGAGDPVTAATIHVAPADARTTVGAARVFRLAPGRCVGDPLFASIAPAYGARAIGVVLSGRLDDGAAGLRAIKAAGGRGLVQDPATAEADGMPMAAMSTGCYDFVLEPEGLARALVALVSVPGAADLLTVRGHPLIAAPPAA
jgi:two-component system, chemotaxis family, protein-glutamate methylesterase/glutaminase